MTLRCGIVPLLLTLLSASEVAAQRAESVAVQKVAADAAVIVRRNGDAYLIDKGVGCLSLSRFEGKVVVISSPGIFLGVGSKLILPDMDQECRIENSKLVDNVGPSARPNSRSLAAQSEIDQFSFFDSQGRAAVYLDMSDGFTFFLWSGEPVAYLDADSIYGFNGKHLGWYSRGSIYDEDGNVVAGPAAAFQTPPEPPPARGFKSFKPLKGLKELKPLKPLFGRSWSPVTARIFFALGAN